ncbi:hypothetical protein BD324DRAFT_652783 [Kockovaella imperatae]|uniref:Extracellular membrane protein CFEM domain-containing protein n=1 Tax=Kockovaella imperatae TaxID=4999 RepID=A0A1Y1UDB3_9TREE|nr:hypothetical protein BD324DRAFT_652783 [Kockovaella imperatae]ORX35065.1 hypothetical protein BD324DRAFT_652783 [Kockovaella imperatae]
MTRILNLFYHLTLFSTSLGLIGPSPGDTKVIIGVEFTPARRQVAESSTSASISAPIPSSGSDSASTSESAPSSALPSLTIDFSALPSSKTSASAFEPAPSALDAASRNTTALQYAQYLNELAPTNCTVDGGGCSVFQYAITECVADDCACQDDLTLAAMVCTQCIATQEGVMVYNTYLNWCDIEGVADPTDTFSVSVRQSGGGSGIMSGIQAAQTVISTSTAVVTLTVSASESQAQGSSQASSQLGSVGSSGVSSLGFSSTTSLLGGVMAIGLGADNESSPPPSAVVALIDPTQPSSKSSLATMTSAIPSIGISSRPQIFLNAIGLDSSSTSSLPGSTASSFPSTASSPSEAEPVSSSILETSSGGVPMTALNGINLGALPSGQASISALPSPMEEITMLGNGLGGSLALNAAIAFFSNVAVPGCDNQCSVWKGLSNTCTQDQCICTAAGVSSAASCSSCIGSGSNGQSPPAVQANYAAFMGNCSEGVGILAPSGSPGPSGYEIVAAASSALAASQELGPTGSLAPPSISSGHGVVNAAEQQAMVTVTSAAGRKVPISIPLGSVSLSLIALGLGALLKA